MSEGYWLEHLERIRSFLIISTAGNLRLQPGKHTASPQVRQLRIKEEGEGLWHTLHFWRRSGGLVLQRESSSEENGSRDCETAKAHRGRLFKINNLQTKINLTDTVLVNIYKQELDIH